MGSETSKIEAPEEFGRSGNQFHIISPVSDLSCPSDIHRIHRLRTQHQNPRPAVSDPSRRISKTVTKTLGKQNSASGGRGDVPPPSQFYFPTKESEKAVERAERRSIKENEKENEGAKIKKIIKKTQQAIKMTQLAMSGCFAEGHAAQLEAAQRMEEAKHHPTLGIARKVLPPKSKRGGDFDDQTSITPSASERRRNNARALAMARADSRPNLESAPDSTSYMLAQAALHQADDYFTRLTTTGRVKESPYVQNKVFKHTRSALGKDEPESPVSGLSLGAKQDYASNDSIIGSSLAESDVKRNYHSLSSTSSDKVKEFVSPFSRSKQNQQAVGIVADTPDYFPEDYDDDSDPAFLDNTNEEVSQAGKASNHLSTISEKGDDESSNSSGLHAMVKNTNSAFRPRNSLHSSRTQQSVLALATYNTTGRKVSKLESLFRPVLPTLSADDAQTAGSFDRFEIKVTESAPGAIESTDYRTIGVAFGHPKYQNMTALEKKLAGRSPSMLSIDSQLSAITTNEALSTQAHDNGKFLFSADGKESKYLFQLKHQSERESGRVTINTAGARSRLSKRVGSKSVAISDKNSLSHCSYAIDDQSQYSKESSRRVRFSLLDVVSTSVSLAPKESIDVPAIESKMSDLTDTCESREKEPISSMAMEEVTSVAPVDDETDNDRSSQSACEKDDVAPISDSAHMRFQLAKTKFQSEAFVEVPAIQNKVSDMTDRSSFESTKSAPDAVPQAAESDTPEPISEQQVNWSYSLKDGDLTAVTPHFSKGAKLATKSPYIRFENAKNKFNGNPRDRADFVNKNTALEKKDTTTSGREETSVLKKDKASLKGVPIKSPRSSRAKQAIKITRPLKHGGSVASKIQELNQRVVDAKIDRKNHRWTKSNPRKYGVIDSNAVRTRAIVQYKTNVVGLDRINYMSAAKFNSIPIDDDSSIDASLAESYKSKKSVTFADTAPLRQRISGPHKHAEYEDDNGSKLSTDDMSKITVESVATLRQTHYSMPSNYNMSNNYSSTSRVSEGTSSSSSSSGLTNIKKQVFGGSVAMSVSSRRSLSSHGESTTMSSILDKENSSNFPFRANANTVKPTEQTIVLKPEEHLSHTQNTPGQAQKWRHLAAAANLRDSEKKLTTARRGLGEKSGNKIVVA